MMEYLNGGDLDAMLSHVGCLPLATVRHYVAELVLALEYLHGQASAAPQHHVTLSQHPHPGAARTGHSAPRH